MLNYYLSKLKNNSKRKRLKSCNFVLARILYRCPNKKSIVIKPVILTPRKPNSARRKSVKARYKLNKIVFSYVPGGAHNLKKFSSILVKGKGPRDLPGVYLHSIRGCLDLESCKEKTKRRSIYGVKKKKMLNNIKIKKKYFIKLLKKNDIILYTNVIFCLFFFNSHIYLHNGKFFSRRYISLLHKGYNSKNFLLTKKIKNKFNYENIRS